ncbi:MAG: EmrB/QacA family drug resistance transporter, partial [Rhizobium ruizarguesonis]
MSRPATSAACPISSTHFWAGLRARVMSNAPASPAAPIANRGAITACVILAVIMQALDTTIANVALPYI